MTKPKYEHGDQVEARVILWYTPGEHLLRGRTVCTVWRGDIAVDSQVSKPVVLRNRDECGVFAGLWAQTLWLRFESDLTPEGNYSSILGDAPGPLTA